MSLCIITDKFNSDTQVNVIPLGFQGEDSPHNSSSLGNLLKQGISLEGILWVASETSSSTVRSGIRL